MSRTMDFEITTYDFTAKNRRAWTFPHNYHYLYILENGRDVYVGETNDIWVRSDDHHKSKDLCAPFHFQRIHVITGEMMEASPALHYEAMLIKLLRADRKFRVVNGEGVRTFYPRKNEFELGFDRLWLQLEDRGLVRHKEFQSLLNSTAYKYSPYACLTEEQYTALNGIVNALVVSDSQKQRNAKKTRPVLVEGDAGSGKTVIASVVFHYLKTHPDWRDKRIGLVYANPATRKELKKVFRGIPGHFGRDIISPVDVTKQFYDVLICDEAQCLRRDRNLGKYVSHFRKGNARLGLADGCDELDWVLKNSKYQVLLYDKKQIVAPSDIPAEEFRARLEIDGCGTRPVALNDQMRIRAGNGYVSYLFDVLYQRAEEPRRFPNYDFRLFASFGDMVRTLREKEKAMGQCRLCGGYAWKWTSKDKPEVPDIEIDGVGVWRNEQTGGWLGNEKAKDQMGSVYSLPGLDLNYAAVVIGPDLYFDPEKKKIQVDRAHYFDNKVKRDVSDEELRNYVLRSYALLMTRGIYGTLVYVCDGALRAYLRDFIPGAEVETEGGGEWTT